MILKLETMKIIHKTMRKMLSKKHNYRSRPHFMAKFGCYIRVYNQYLKLLYKANLFLKKKYDILLNSRLGRRPTIHVHKTKNFIENWWQLPWRI